MITKKTVLVLGAGASMAYGLPSGPELKARVVHQLEQPNTIQLLEQLGQDRDFIGRFRDDLAQSHPPSIDAYLAIRDDYVEIGKLAIAATLLPLEQQKELFRKWYDPYVWSDIEHPDNGHWYQELCGMMDPMMNLENNELAVITFNYDRSLEQYLYTSLRNLYGPYGPSGDMNKYQIDQECAEKVQAIPIIHVYGQLGALPWDNSGMYKVAYDLKDKAKGPDKVRRAAKHIEIVPEARKNSNAFKAAHKLLEEAERIYFLGFGFDPTNVRRLLPPRLLKANSTKIYGTFFDMSRQRRQFLGDYGFTDVLHELGIGGKKDLSVCRFRDQKICDWLKENDHAQFG